MAPQHGHGHRQQRKQVVSNAHGPRLPATLLAEIDVVPDAKSNLSKPHASNLKPVAKSKTNSHNLKKPATTAVAFQLRKTIPRVTSSQEKGGAPTRRTVPPASAMRSKLVVASSAKDCGKSKKHSDKEKPATAATKSKSVAKTSVKKGDSKKSLSSNSKIDQKATRYSVQVKSKSRDEDSEDSDSERSGEDAKESDNEEDGIGSLTPLDQDDMNDIKRIQYYENKLGIARRRKQHEKKISKDTSENHAGSRKAATSMASLRSKNPIRSKTQDIDENSSDNENESDIHDSRTAGSCYVPQSYKDDGLEDIFRFVGKY